MRCGVVRGGIARTASRRHPVTVPETRRSSPEMPGSTTSSLVIPVIAGRSPGAAAHGGTRRERRAARARGRHRRDRPGRGFPLHSTPR